MAGFQIKPINTHPITPTVIMTKSVVLSKNVNSLKTKYRHLSKTPKITDCYYVVLDKYKKH